MKNSAQIMEKIKTVEQCSVDCIFDNGVLKSIIKKDMVSHKNLIYMVKEAKCDDIVDLIISEK